MLLDRYNRPMSRRTTETVEVQPGSRIWTPDQTRLYTAAAEVSSSIILEATTTIINSGTSYADILKAHGYARAARLAVHLRNNVEEIITSDNLSNFQMGLSVDGYANELLRKHLVNPAGVTYGNIETTAIPDLLLHTSPNSGFVTLNGRRCFNKGIVANFPKQLTLPKRG